MDGRKLNIIDDLIGLVGDKAVLQTTDDMESYLSDWHAPISRVSACGCSARDNRAGCRHHGLC